jgi:hypothetical protein
MRLPGIGPHDDPAAVTVPTLGEHLYLSGIAPVPVYLWLTVPVIASRREVPPSLRRPFAPVAV